MNEDEMKKHASKLLIKFNKNQLEIGVVLKETYEAQKKIDEARKKRKLPEDKDTNTLLDGMKYLKDIGFMPTHYQKNEDGSYVEITDPEIIKKIEDEENER